MTKNITTWLPDLEKWELSDYDGIKGMPPNWIPQPNIKKFRTARFVIFDGVTEGQYDFNEVTLRFDDLVKNKFHRVVLALMNDHKTYDEHLFYLVDLYNATLLGEIEGLRLLGGDVAAMGASYSK